MSGDYSREIAFADIRVKDKKVRFYQGRCMTDAQLNANTDLLEAQREIALTDVIGKTGWPKERPGFGLIPNDAGGLNLSAGHMYLDGVLFENDKELSYNLADSVTVNEPYLAYFIGQKNDYNYLMRDFIRDPALGGPDTAGRGTCRGSVTVARVSDILEFAELRDVKDIKEAARAGHHIPLPHCGFGDAAIKISINTSAIRPDNACLIQDNARYKGRDNINYHIEVHQPSASGNPTIKWATQFVEARLEKNADGDFILVGNIDDSLMSFKTGDAVEVKDSWLRETNAPGMMGTITNNADGTYTLSPAIATAYDSMVPPVMVRRWDHNPTDFPNGIPVGSSAIDIQSGIRVQLRGDLITGDHWQCAARVSTGDLLWPPVETSDGYIPPFNWRRCAVLAIFERSEGGMRIIEDLRNTFPSLTHIDAKDVSFSSNRCDFGSDTPTVHAALEKICAKIERDGCTIRVRPDDFEDLNVPYAGFGHYPTLREVFDGLSEFLKQTNTVNKARAYKRRHARMVSLTPEIRENIMLEALEGLRPEPAIRIPMRIQPIRRQPGLNFGLAEDISILPDVAADIGIVRQPNLDDGVINDVTARSDTPEEKENPYFLYRRLSLEFLPGDYLWPKDLEALFTNMSSICLTACCAGNVNIKSSQSLVFSNCVNVSVKGINLFFTSSDAQFSATGGKLIKIVDVKMERRVKADLPLASMSAKRRIKLKDCRFRLTHVKTFNGARLGIHIEDSRAHTSFNDVQCNGFVVLGEGIPSINQDPFPDILEASKSRVLSSVQIEPFKINTQSNNTARIESCRFFGLVPGGKILTLLEKWANRQNRTASEKKLLPFRTLHVQDSEFQEGYNIFFAKIVMLRDNRFSDFGSNTCVAGSKLTAKTTRPYKNILRKMTHHDDGDNKRLWAPIALTICRRSSIQSNMGFRENINSDNLGYPAILDYSQRDSEIGDSYELEQTLYSMAQLRMLVFHGYYLQQTN